MRTSTCAGAQWRRGRRDDDDCCYLTAAAGMHRLTAGDDALAAAVTAVIVLDDDGHFDAVAGPMRYGAVLCLHGATVEINAAVMASRGMLGAVACIQRVRKPVLVARTVAGGPHCLLAGEGAERYACRAGDAPYCVIDERVRREHAALLTQLATGACPVDIPGRRAPDRKEWRDPVDLSPAIF